VQVRPATPVPRRLRAVSWFLTNVLSREIGATDPLDAVAAQRQPGGMCGPIHDERDLESPGRRSLQLHGRYAKRPSWTCGRARRRPAMVRRPRHCLSGKCDLPRSHDAAGLSVADMSRREKSCSGRKQLHHLERPDHRVRIGRHDDATMTPSCAPRARGPARADLGIALIDRQAGGAGLRKALAP